MDIPGPKLKLLAAPLSAQAMLRVMLAQEGASRVPSGATVEVIGYEEEAVLKVLSLGASEHTRLNFHIMSLRGQQELYALMHQDPGHSTPVLFVPILAGRPSPRPRDQWIR